MKNIIAYRITAVPERKDNALLEASVAGIPKDCIYMDHNHNGNIWNKFRVYRDLIQTSYTHVCMNDDDLILPENYKELVQTAVDRFPDAILTFYNSKIWASSPTFFKMQNHYMNGASCVIPTKYLSKFLAFYESELNGFRWDDTAMSIYALLNDIDVYLYSPKIVDVIHTLSTLPMRKGRYQPHNVGYSENVSEKDIENASIVYQRGILNTHLKDCKVKQMCMAKLED